MMKNNNKKKGSTAKKLMPAAMMLAVSASMLGTSTYAWFSMNKTVSVQSMSIAAKSADAIIEISANGTNFYNGLVSSGEGANWTLPTTDNNTKLKLVTPSAIATSGTVGAVSWGWAASSNHADAEVTNALTAKSLVAQSSPSATENGRAKYLGIENDGLYVLTQKLTIRNVSPDVDASNLKINSVDITKGTNTIANAVRVLFVNADGSYAMYKPGSSGTAATLVADHQWLDAQGATATDMSASSGIPVVAATLAAKGTGDSPAAGSSTEVDVYVFFDGTDAAAFTDNATDLSNVSVQFTFGID